MDGQDNTRIIDRKYPSYWLKGAAEDQLKDWHGTLPSCHLLD